MNKILILAALAAATQATVLTTENECIGPMTTTTEKKYTVASWGVGDSSYGYGAYINSTTLYNMIDGSSACTHFFIHDFIISSTDTPTESVLFSGTGNSTDCVSSFESGTSDDADASTFSITTDGTA